MVKYMKKGKRTARQLFLGILFVILITAGWLFNYIGYFILICMLIGVGMSFFKGRKWCDWYCPRGSFFDGLLSQISRQKQIPSIIKNIPFRLVILTILFSSLTFMLTQQWSSPIKIGKVFLTVLTTTTAIGIFLGIIYHQRSWCYLCPAGTLSNLIGKNKYHLKLDEENCANCGVCAKDCPMQLEPYNIEESNMDDCLKCESCVNKCPKKVLGFN